MALCWAATGTLLPALLVDLAVSLLHVPCLLLIFFSVVLLIESSHPSSPLIVPFAEDTAQCTSASYVGGYSAERCRTGCGSLSQALYKVPVGLLHSADR